MNLNDSEKKVSVLIADDHPIFRKGVVYVLSEETNLQIVAEANDGNEALELILKFEPDIAILDIEMPGRNGLEVAQIVLRNLPSVKIVFLTMYREETIFNKAMDLGIYGFVLKENAVVDIINCISAVMQNKYFISPLIADYLVKRDNKETNTLNNIDLSQLTPSEMRIFNSIAEGKRTKDIAVELNISFKTVENHRNNICKKLGISGTFALSRYALKRKNK